MARNASAQILETIGCETELVEVITGLPFPDDAPVGCDFVDSLISDDVRAESSGLHGES
jgi:hypothetical protein